MTARSPRPPLSPPRPRPDAGSTAAAAAERTQHERGRDRRPTRTLQPVAIDHALGARARSCIVAQRADRERPRVSARCIVPALAAALASRERRRRVALPCPASQAKTDASVLRYQKCCHLRRRRCFKRCAWTRWARVRCTRPVVRTLAGSLGVVGLVCSYRSGHAIAILYS